MSPDADDARTPPAVFETLFSAFLCVAGVDHAALLCGGTSDSPEGDVLSAWQTTRTQPRTANFYLAAYACIRVLARQPQQPRHVTIGIRIR